MTSSIIGVVARRRARERAVARAAARRRRARRRPGRASETKRAVVDREQGVHGDERVARRPRRAAASGIGPVGGVLDGHDDLDERARTRRPSPRRDAHRSRRPARSAGGSAPDLGPVRAQLLDVLAGSRAQRASRARLVSSGKSGSSARSTSCSTASSHGTHRCAVDVELTDFGEAAAGPCELRRVRRCTCRQRTRTVSRGSAPGSTTHSVRHGRALGAVGVGARRGARARRTASASGSSAPTPGTGTARSPRRAPRRPRHGAALRSESHGAQVVTSSSPGFLEQLLARPGPTSAARGRP